MAGLVRREVEILVHATAPSRGQDDARYRALAQAYLDFDPAAIHRLEDKADDVSEEDADAQANSQLQEEFEHSTLEERESEASYRPDDERETGSVAHSSISRQNKGLESPVLSFSSALDNADSPVWRGSQNCPQKLPSGPQTIRQVSQASDEIADSQPEHNKTIAAFSSPTRILELYLQQVQSSGERSSSSYGIGRNKQQICGPSPELPYGIQHSQSGTPERVGKEPSLTPGTPLSPSPQKRQKTNCQPVSKRSKARIPFTQDPAMSTKRKWPESSLDNSHVSSSAPTELSIESSTVTTRTTRSRKRQCLDGSVDEITRTKEVTSSKVTMVTTSSAPSFEAKYKWADKSEIRPPSPRTSTKDLTPDILITSTMQQLAQKMPLTVLFRPKIQTRDLRPMERGHWIVTCGNWDPGVRKRCWECLGNFIERGLVGWGVWCIRNEELDNIKVYCWGTIVGHVYLMLYLASESKIKAAGSSWIGGDGEAIITMPG